MTRCFAIWLAVLVLAGVLPEKARALDIVDILGRSVTLDGPADRVLLGEGRFLAAVDMVTDDNPVDRVAGMLNDFRKLDPSGFSRYRDAYPDIDQVPNFGQTSDDSVSVETAISLSPAAAVFGIQGHGPSPRSRVILDALGAAGIPVVFIDFRQSPLQNTATSLRILGRLLGSERAAETAATLHEREMERVTSRLASARVHQPTVLLEVHVGLRPECCFSMASGSLAELIEAAGGRNYAGGRLPGPVGLLSLEGVLDDPPDLYLGTAIGDAGGAPSDGRIKLGAGVDRAVARDSLRSALERAGMAGIPAVADGNAYAIWHHFYNSPLNVYALQRFAKWFHPALFDDLDPEATLRSLLARSHPVDLDGVYGIALRP